MKNRLAGAFDKIYAEENLKIKTAAFLKNEIQQKGLVKKNPPFRRPFLYASSFLILFASVIFSHLYFTPAIYVDIDVNPSVEITLNRFGRVIGTTPYNDDGIILLDHTNIRYKTYNEAMGLLMGSMIEQGYLNEDNLISVTVQAKNENTEKKTLSGIQESIDLSLSAHHTTASMDIFAVSQETKAYAHGQNLSPAKYMAIKQLQEIDPAVTIESCRNHSISQIHQLTQQHGQKHNSNQQQNPVVLPDEQYTPNQNGYNNGKGHHGKGHD